MRIFAISDLHFDHGKNLTWLDRLSRQDYVDDVIIIAGDLCTDIGLLEQTLTELKTIFADVFYTPGNHELWLRPDKDHFACSMTKCKAIFARCAAIEVQTSANYIQDEDKTILIAPIHAWYTKPEHGDDSLFLPKQGEDRSLSMWADEYYVKWQDSALATRPIDYLLSLNDTALDQKPTDIVISFSHFLPRHELMSHHEIPHPMDPVPSFNFSRVAGSTLIENTLRQLGSSLHIYGHQHYNRALCLEQTYYVSACYGYSYQSRGRQKWGLDNGPLCVCTHGEITPWVR